jgi:hypothetical protein
MSYIATLKHPALQVQIKVWTWPGDRFVRLLVRAGWVPVALERE